MEKNEPIAKGKSKLKQLFDSEPTKKSGKTAPTKPVFDKNGKKVAEAKDNQDPQNTKYKDLVLTSYLNKIIPIISKQFY